MSRSEGIFRADIDVSSNDLRRRHGVQLAVSEKLLLWNYAFFMGSGPRLVWPRELVRRTRGMISSCVVHMFFVTFSWALASGCASSLLEPGKVFFAHVPTFSLQSICYGFCLRMLGA